MYVEYGDGIKFSAQYISTGRGNERVEGEGYGFVVSEEFSGFVTVDIGIRSTKVKTSDILQNYGKNPPFTLSGLSE